MEFTERDEARFWAKVAPADGNGCMLWLAAMRPDGYGAFGLQGRMVRAHRASYTLINGPIPDGLVLDHLCRRQACVAPLHLEAVTQRENTLRGMTVPAANAAKTHCPQGHAYDVANTRVRLRDMSRQCRKCDADRHRVAPKES